MPAAPLLDSPDATRRLALPRLRPAQAQKHVTHNEALARLDGLVQLVLETTGAETPPAAAPEGTVHGLGPAPGAAWAGQGGRLALAAGGGWVFADPGEGWLGWDRAAGRLVVHRDGAWRPAVTEDLAAAGTLGLNAGADSATRLAVAAQATRLSHDGAGHRLIVNKAAPAETASLLFQSGWAGRAEIGLPGHDDLTLKVSADGTAWREALRVEAATGALHLSHDTAASARGAGGWTDIAAPDIPLPLTARDAGAMPLAGGALTVPAGGLYAAAVSGVADAATEAALALSVNGAATSHAVELRGAAPVALTALLALAPGDAVGLRTGPGTTLLRYDAGRTHLALWKVA
ncbi:Protein of unknown function [Tranquillimonas rosea]|uniref:DUF2793 domain-containing protein n=1 Tax=Tranquillimonas rosea TaxID=641238 RepID=A0A1H9WYT6_9RHOB|nr:DUF2793 domain-containing protein [Tranquillimonas rosea]SES39118.1 Protein of unknown function [Tranquillimonas rosea]